MKYKVLIENPMSMNNAWATDFKTGRRFLTLEGKKYAGEKRDMPKRGKIDDAVFKDMTLIEGVNYRQLPRGKIYVFGSLYYRFKSAGVPIFPEKTKVIVDAWALWPDQKARDMSNLQKLAEDVLQKGGFIPNDSYLLWRNIDFTFSQTDQHLLKLEIFQKEAKHG